MISYLGCDATRNILQDFVDGELPIPEQVAVEAHLRWCESCSAHVEDLRFMGALLRRRAVILAGAGESRALMVMQSTVLTRVGTERDLSLPVRAREMLRDMRLLWQALGATAALLACMSGVTGVGSILKGVRPDSMAAVISLLANPGSDQNPMVLDNRMLAPRTLDIGSALAELCNEDAEFAVAAVVTREGRVSNYSLLHQMPAHSTGHQGAVHADGMSVLSDTVRQSRFAPAQTPDGAVAVNVVWLLSRTTVRASVMPGGSLAPLLPERAHASNKPVSGPLARRALRPARS